MSDIDLAYIAGLIDGEGCIRIKKTHPSRYKDVRNPTYYPYISIGMCDRIAIDFLVQILNTGCRWTKKFENPNHRTVYYWEASHKNAERAIKTVYQYLKVKKPVADAVLGLIELKSQSRKHRPHGFYTDEFVQKMENLFQRCGKLNGNNYRKPLSHN